MLRTIIAFATTIARIAEASARCASLTIGFRDVVTVTIPRSTWAINATTLVAERRTTLSAALYLVEATMHVPTMKTPTTELNSRRRSSMITSGLLSEGQTAT